MSAGRLVRDPALAQREAGVAAGRDIAALLNKDPRVERYVVESENFESIHNHSAYALIEGPQAPG